MLDHIMSSLSNIRQVIYHLYRSNQMTEDMIEYWLQHNKDTVTTKVEWVKDTS